MGAAVPERFRERGPVPDRGGRPRRRERPEDASWRHQEVGDEVLAEVARQAAARRLARDEARRGLAGRLRISRPKAPGWWELWKGLRLPVRLVTVALPALALAGLLAVNLPFLKVQRVEVEGSSVVSRSRLLAEAGISLGQSALVVNAGRLTANLLARPWVGSARVSIRWPGTLLVAVTPLPPVLVYRRAGRQELLAASGALLGPVPAGSSSVPLPALDDLRPGRGPGPGRVAVQPRLAAALAALARAFPAAYGVAVKSFQISRIGTLEIQTSAGWTADLGPVLTRAQVGALGPKLEALRALGAKESLSHSAIKTIYLEDPSQVVVVP